MSDEHKAAALDLIQAMFQDTLSEDKEQCPFERAARGLEANSERDEVK